LTDSPVESPPPRRRHERFCHRRNRDRGAVEGWLTFFQQLRFYLERHPGQDRRTVHVATAGEEWFRSEHQSGEVRDDGALVIRTPSRVIVSEYP